MANREYGLLDGGEDSMGMSDMQFKSYLLEQLENWQEVLELAKEANDTKVQEKAERQIAKLNQALKF